MTVNWEAVGAIGELVGAVGVIVTLFYLAVQVRQNSAVVRSSTRQAISTNQWETGMRMAENPELAALARQLTDVPPDMSDTQLRAEYFLRAVLRQYENQFHHYKDATFEEAVWSGYLQNMKRTFASPFARSFWQHNRTLYSTDFVEFADANLLGATQENG